MREEKLVKEVRREGCGTVPSDAEQTKEGMNLRS